MKYNLSINLKALYDISNEIDITEAYLLDWIIPICLSKNKKVDKERHNGYTWINYSNIIKELPLLNIKTKSGISKRINSLEQLGFIKTITKTIKTNNIRKYVEITELCDNLFKEAEEEKDTSNIPSIKGNPKVDKVKEVESKTTSSSEKVDNTGSQINEIYTLYTKNNPLLTWDGSNFFASRKIIKKQIEVYGFEEIKRVTQWILDNKDLNEYIPKISIPFDLSKKWNNVQDAMKRNDVAGSKVIDVKATGDNAKLEEFLLPYEQICLYDNIESVPAYQKADRLLQIQLENIRETIYNYLHFEDFNNGRSQRLIKDNLDQDLDNRNKRIKELINTKQNLILDKRALLFLE